MDLSLMSANERTIRRYFDELFNQGRIDLVPELLAEDYVNHSPGWPGLPTGRDGVVQVVEAMRGAFPDLHYTIDELVVTERAVAARTTLRGTHLGAFGDLAATGRRVQVAQVTLEYLRAGRIVAHHRVTDERALLEQLGVPV